MATTKIFKKDEAVVRKISESYQVSNFLIADDSDMVSVAVGDAKNHDEITKTSSNRAYYILEGEIVVDDSIIGNTGDVVFIPANTEYRFKGTFKAVIVNSPAFKKSNEKTNL